MDPGDASFSSECDRPQYKKTAELMLTDQETLHTVLHYNPLEHLQLCIVMNTLFGVRSALKELYAIKNIDLR